MARYSFWGQFEHSLDSKNRVAIPAKFRQQITEGKVFVTEFFEDCLAVFPEDEWKKFIEAELSGLSPIASSRNRKVERLLYGSAHDCELDKQGRIKISGNHLKISGITKEVVFKGVNNRFEIWDRKKWEAYRTAYSDWDDTDS